MAMCSVCGKRRRAGKNVSHSNRHTNRWFLPNVQKAVITVKGKRIELTATSSAVAKSK